MQISKYWERRLSDCKNSLEKNNFDAFIVGAAFSRDYYIF
jgi:hypothetical protein